MRLQFLFILLFPRSPREVSIHILLYIIKSAQLRRGEIYDFGVKLKNYEEHRLHSKFPEKFDWKTSRAILIGRKREL